MKLELSLNNHAWFYHAGGNIQTKYNSKQAALYKDKILTESQGGFWDEDKSPAQKHVGSLGGGGLKTSSQARMHQYSVHVLLRNIDAH